MFDYHLHTRVSFDSEEAPENTVRAAERLGLREICFTDHYDYRSDPDADHILFDLQSYADNYDSLTSDRVKIRRGVEFGLTAWDTKELDEFLAKRDFDFVIGSVHCVEGYDPYDPEYWQDGKDTFEKYLLCMLECVRAHSNFDVLGHMSYVCKSPCNPTKKPLRYRDYADLCDEIMRELIKKGRGMEINTSGIDRVGEPLPSRDYLIRFRELGGEIVTVGSDAHDAARVGNHIFDAIALASEIFGYVCTFEKRKPIFHRI